MEQEFSWKRDLNIVSWRATIIHNLMRATGAGIIISVVMLLWGDVGFLMGLSYVVIWPIGYLIFMLPLGMLTGALSRAGVPWVGLVSFFFALFVAIGDPLVFLLYKFRPDLVLVDKPGFFDFSVIEFVIDAEKERRLKAKASGVVRDVVPGAVADAFDQAAGVVTEDEDGEPEYPQAP